MKPAVAYIVVTHGVAAETFCARFVATWLTFPPGIDCDLYVICNGGPLPAKLAMLFSLIPNVQFIPRENDEAKDIGGYQHAAKLIGAEWMFCCGESVYFHQEGWLKRLSDVVTRFPGGMYGVFSSHLVRAHLNTTAFACDRQLLLRYPIVKNGPERYEFEHGSGCFWRRANQMGRPTLFVTWDGIYYPTQWRVPQNILWRGTQGNLLVWCNHTDRWFDSDVNLRSTWSRLADQPFQ